MKVVELRDLSRREAPIHYLREYTAVAVLEAFGSKSETGVAFTVEQKPLGPPDISVRVLDPVDWPILPVSKALRDHFADMDKRGLLP